MREILGKTEYEIVRLSKDKYRVIIGGSSESFIVNATEDDLDRLMNYINMMKQSAPIDVIEARKKGVCRICSKPIAFNEAVIYNYGKEHAHSKCLIGGEDY